MNILDKIEQADRRIIFLIILVSVITPLLLPLKFPINVTDPVQNVYNYVETLPEGSVIWMGFDYYLTTKTECDPQATAFLKHVFRKNCKVVVTSTIPDGAQTSQIIMDKIAKEYGKEYGKDYVILGYKPGTSVFMMQFCRDIKGTFATDVKKTPVDKIPLLNKVKNAGDFAMVFTATDNQTFDYLVSVASTQFHVPMAGGSTAVSVPLIYVYFNSGQVLGFLGGLKGAAEYESLMDYSGTATSGMVAQSFVHILIVLMILFANVVYFMKKFGKTE